MRGFDALLADSHDQSGFSSTDITGHCIRLVLARKVQRSGLSGYLLRCRAWAEARFVFCHGMRTGFLRVLAAQDAQEGLT